MSLCLCQNALKSTFYTVSCTESLQGGLNEGARTALLAHSRPPCGVIGKDRVEFVVVPKRFKKHVLHRFVH